MRKIVLTLGVLVGMSSCMVSRSYQLTGEPIGEKVGVAKSKIIGNSDTSIKTAAANGGIKVIGAVEVTTKLFIFPITKTKVYGN
jgi:hypothetical protein